MVRRPAALGVHGWAILAHPIFLAQSEFLFDAVTLAACANCCPHFPPDT